MQVIPKSLIKASQRSAGPIKLQKICPNNFAILCSFLNLHFSWSTSWNYLSSSRPRNLFLPNKKLKISSSTSRNYSYRARLGNSERNCKNCHSVNIKVLFPPFYFIFVIFVKKKKSLYINT